MMEWRSHSQLPQPRALAGLMFWAQGLGMEKRVREVHGDTE